MKHFAAITLFVIGGYAICSGARMLAGMANLKSPTALALFTVGAACIFLFSWLLPGRLAAFRDDIAAPARVTALPAGYPTLSD